MDTRTYLQRVKNSVSEQDGGAIANLFRIDATAAVTDLTQFRDSAAIIEACQRSGVPNHLDTAVAAHCESTLLLTQGSDWDRAFDLQLQGSKAFLEYYKQPEMDWLVPALQRTLVNLRLVAQKVDKVMGLGKDKSKVRDVKTHLDTCFRYTMMARGAGVNGHSKRQAALFIVNNQLKVYFRLGTLHLCRNVINSVGKGAFPPLENFGLKQVVTHRFFVGRLKVFEDDIQSAHDELSFAFKHCPARYQRNRRLILEYLVPVKLIMGQPPRPQLLEQYGLTELAQVAAAVAHGNVGQLNSAIVTHQASFIARGTYLALNKLKLVAYRNLVRTVFKVQTQMIDAGEASEGEHRFRLRMPVLLAAFRLRGEYSGVVADLAAGPGAGGVQQQQQQLSQEEKDFLAMDQLECILANLIFKGYVKGYIAHDRGIVVLSKVAAFPAISTLAEV